jgi:hypothetical protein
MAMARLKSTTNRAVSPLEPMGNAEYRGLGRVIRCYRTGGEHVAVIETPEFRFYVHGRTAADLRQDTSVEFEGTLLLDHYLWVEFLDRYPDPPDLFFSLRVTRIRKVSIPDRFVRRGSRSISSPARVGPNNFGHVKEVESMDGANAFQEFYLVDFDDTGLNGVKVARTFQ